VNAQLQLAFDAEELQLAETEPRKHGRDGRVSRPGTAPRLPRGITVGQVVEAERSHWTVLDFDFERSEFVPKLIGGSGSLRRFSPRAVRITRSDR
jgi:hypothetical protein